MRIVTYYHGDKQHLGILIGNGITDIQQSYLVTCKKLKKSDELVSKFSSMLDFLAGGQVVCDAIDECLQFVNGEYSREDQRIMGLVYDVNEVFLQAPISNPGKVIAVGGNYPAVGKLASPEFPVIFLKPASTITGPGKPILVSNLTTSVNYEVELVVVIGKNTHRVEVAEALGHVAGYSLANDLGDRLLEKRTSQWTTGKMFDTFTPLGPAILTKDEFPGMLAQAMETHVNGQLVQRGNTSDMFFNVSQLVSYISNLTTLASGDLILTGSPKLMNGEIPPSVSLKPGDVVRVTIEGLGELSNPVEAEQE
jgi:acylpyruvate hydrolase